MKKILIFLLILSSFNLFSQGKMLKIGPSSLATRARDGTTILHYGLELEREWSVSKHWSFGLNGSYFQSSKYEEEGFVFTTTTFTAITRSLSSEIFGFQPYARRYQRGFDEGSFWSFGIDIRSVNIRNYTQKFADSHDNEQHFILSFGNRTKMTDLVYCDQLFSVGISGDSNQSPVSFRLGCLFGLRR